MTKAISPLERAIGHKADKVRLLAATSESLELDRLRDETAALQSLIAEAARLQTLQRPFDVQGTAVFCPVLIRADEFVGYCLVTNLSPDGMKAKVYASFSRPQPICVHFASHDQVRGTLVWTGPDQVGVQFHRQIDVPRVLSSLGGKNVGIGANRPARLPIRCLAEISDGERYQFVEVADVSQRGVKILTDLGQSGRRVAVQLHELDQREATVRWSKAGLAGLAFSRPLSFPELAQFVPAGTMAC